MTRPYALAMPYQAAHTMTDDVQATPEQRSARKGVVIGILLVVLLALAVYFFWRGTGFRDESGQRPPPPPQLPN